VFLVALLREFGWSRSLLAGAFSLFALVHGGLSPMLGQLCDRLGPRRLVAAGGVIVALALAADSAISRPWHLYVAFGGLTAIGVAMSGWVPAVVLVQRWFPHRLGFALGIAGSGIGLGIFLVVPLCQVLIEWLGWRWAFRALGALAALWIVPATLALVRDPRPAGAAVPTVGAGSRRGVSGAAESPRADSDTARDAGLTGAVRSAPFWLLAAACFLGNYCTQTVLVHQAAYLVDHGIPALTAASVVSMVGVASIVGKTGGGWLSDIFGREIIYSLGILCVVSSVGALALVALASGPLAAYSYGVLMGIGYSVTASLMPAVVGDRYRGRHFGTIFGMLQVAQAFGGATGPWLAGRLFDATGSYRTAFMAAVAAAAVATGALWTIRWGRPRR
jgi:MFS family permease